MGKKPSSFFNVLREWWWTALCCYGFLSLCFLFLSFLIELVRWQNWVLYPIFWDCLFVNWISFSVLFFAVFGFLTFLGRK